MKKKPKLRTVTLKAWKIMSEHVRKSAADHTDQCHCVTCGSYDHWKTFDAGHYIHISKQHPLSYDPRNIHPQCRACNYYKSKGVEYANFMYKTYGQATVELLLERKKERYLRRSDLEEFIRDPGVILGQTVQLTTMDNLSQPTPFKNSSGAEYTKVPF